MAGRAPDDGIPKTRPADSTDAVALGLMPGERCVKLFVHDPDLLEGSAFKLEGRGKHMRHIKFTAPPTERRAELVALMRIPVDRRSRAPS